MSSESPLDRLLPILVRTVAHTLEIPLHLHRIERVLAQSLRELPASRLEKLAGLFDAGTDQARSLEETEEIYHNDLELCDEDRHHRRLVGRVTEGLARGLAIAEGPAHQMGRAAEFHDIGKLLLGPPGGGLAHTWAGALLLGPIPGFVGQMARQIALAHHELWSGEGFPFGLAGPQIPLAARLANVAIRFAQGVSGRGRPEMPAAWVRSELCRSACPGLGGEVDPMVVAALYREHSSIDRAIRVH